MAARLMRLSIVLIAAAAAAWASGCACPTRSAVTGEVGPAQKCAQLAPSPEEGRGAPALAPTPPEKERRPSAAEERGAMIVMLPPSEAARIAPGPAVRAAMPFGPVPEGVYLVQPGDSLWEIAARAYRDPFKWRDIYDANRAQISDPNMIYPHQELKIPRVG